MFCKSATACGTFVSKNVAIAFLDVIYNIGFREKNECFFEQKPIKTLIGSLY